MPTDITFFLAPDDEAAAATRNSVPGRHLRSLTSHYFYPDDAVVSWSRYFDAPDQPFSSDERRLHGNWPRYVADIRNDGVGVLVIPETVVTALAEAGPDALRGLAAQWGGFLESEGEVDPDRDEQLAVVKGVAELAAAAVRSGGEERLYCWHD